MKKPEMPQVWQAISCLLCAVFALKITNGLAGTEFSGGRLTGALLSMADIGSFFRDRTCRDTCVSPSCCGSWACVIAALLTTLLFFIAPVPCNQVFGFGHELKVQPTPASTGRIWIATGLLTHAVTNVLCVRRIAARRAPETLSRRALDLAAVGRS
jgi:hypothetical protein